jgi:hypothetical protein
MRLPEHKGLIKVPLQVSVLERYGIDITQCPVCHKKTVQLVQAYYPCKQTEDG